MFIAECAQCGQLSKFIIDIDEEIAVDLQGFATVMIVNNNLYCNITLSDTSTSRLAQRFEHEKITAELHEAIAKYLKRVEVAICPKCQDTCDVTVNFATSSMTLTFTKL